MTCLTCGESSVMPRSDSAITPISFKPVSSSLVWFSLIFKDQWC